MKQKFDELTDLIEHAQGAKPEEATSSTSQDRQVENIQGEMVILNDKIKPDIF